MKQAGLTLALFVAVTGLGIQLPMVRNSILYGAAVLTSQGAYGANLGQVIDDVVNNIYARIPKAQITHADVLTVMCMESAGLVGRQQVITSSAGARGLTQVMPATLAQYAGSHAGGFYLPNRPDLLYSDPRFSIEAGALIFNHHLMNYNGDRTKAAIAYNGGPGRVKSAKLPRETYEYAFTKLPRCYNQIIQGNTPVKSTVWVAMVAKVKELTSGTMALQGSARPSNIASINTVPTAADPVVSMGNTWRQSSWGQFVSGGSQQTTPSYPASAPSTQPVATIPVANYQQYADQAKSTSTSSSLWNLFKTNTESTAGVISPEDSLMDTVSEETPEKTADTVSAMNNAVAAIDYDGTYLKWATLGTSDCMITGAGVSKSGTQGTMYIGAITSDTTYELVCNTDDGVMKYKKTVTREL